MDNTHDQIARLIEIKRFREAQLLLSSQLAADPENADLRVHAACIAKGLGDLPEAHAQLELALSYDPSHVEALAVYFDLLVEEKQYAEAEQIIIQLIRDYPHAAGFLAAYAWLMLLTVHPEKADALNAEALHLDATDAIARRNQVMLALIHGDARTAHGALERLVREDPESVSVIWTMITVLTAQHRPREALRLATELLRVTPNDSDLVDAIIELRAITHWFALPAWPLQRWGWLASGVIWAIMIVMISTLRKTNVVAAGLVALVLLLYILYSWTYFPLLKRWIRWRGV